MVQRVVEMVQRVVEMVQRVVEMVQRVVEMVQRVVEMVMSGERVTMSRERVTMSGERVTGTTSTKAAGMRATTAMPSGGPSTVSMLIYSPKACRGSPSRRRSKAKKCCSASTQTMPMPIQSRLVLGCMMGELDRVNRGHWTCIHWTCMTR
jgi:hypothetical protein